MYQGCTVTKTSHLSIRYFLALLWARPILHISRLRVKHDGVNLESQCIKNDFITSDYVNVTERGLTHDCSEASAIPTIHLLWPSIVKFKSCAQSRYLIDITFSYDEIITLIMVLNNVRQHNCFIIQGSYIGYMFRLIDQSSSGIVEEWNTNLMSLAVLFHYLCAQHVLDVNISIIRSLRLCCWITTLVVFFSVRCVLELWCGWFWVVPVLQASRARDGHL